MWEKSKGTTKCEKITITCNKNRIDAMLVLFNITMEPSNLRRKKNKWIIICDKTTVNFDIEIAQYDNKTIKFEK